MITPDFFTEQKLGKQGYVNIAGIDEVGRGCWAGPVVAAAIFFQPNHVLPPNVTIRDSKTMSKKQREAAEIYIKRNTIWAIGQASPTEIDQIGIGKATRLAMVRAIQTSKPNQIISFSTGENQLTSQSRNNQLSTAMQPLSLLPLPQ